MKNEKLTADQWMQLSRNNDPKFDGVKWTQAIKDELSELYTTNPKLHFEIERKNRIWWEGWWEGLRAGKASKMDNEALTSN